MVGSSQKPKSSDGALIRQSAVEQKEHDVPHVHGNGVTHDLRQLELPDGERPTAVLLVLASWRTGDAQSWPMAHGTPSPPDLLMIGLTPPLPQPVESYMVATICRPSGWSRSKLYLYGGEPLCVGMEMLARWPLGPSSVCTRQRWKADDATVRNTLGHTGTRTRLNGPWPPSLLWSVYMPE